MVRCELLHLPCGLGNGMIYSLYNPKNHRTNNHQADMASAMPTAGGLYFWTHYYSSEKWKNPLSFLVGYSNTIGLIGGVCSIDCESGPSPNKKSP